MTEGNHKETFYPEIEGVELYPEEVTIDNRFQVACSFCGFLASFRTRQAAREYATLAISIHMQCASDITIFDWMAHSGQPEIELVQSMP